LLNSKITIRKDSDEIEGRLPDEAAERRLGNLIKQIQKKELDVELKSDSLNEADANVATDPAVDKVNPYFLKKGVQKILANEKELTNDSYINALNKAAKQLESNPHAFDEDMFANAKEVEKADSKLETEEVKKNNFVNKDRQMKKAKGHNIEKANTKVSTKENKKGKPKGVQMMKESVLQDLLNSLKKKELINEDSHWKHTVGSEVHTPDGPGKIVEIMGSTLTIEMEDGTHKDYQINVVDSATEKAMEEQSSEEPKAEPSKDKGWDMADDHAHHRPTFRNVDGLLPAQYRSMDLTCGILRGNHPKSSGSVFQKARLYKAGLNGRYRHATT